MIDNNFGAYKAAIRRQNREWSVPLVEKRSLFLRFLEYFGLVEFFEW